MYDDFFVLPLKNEWLFTYTFFYAEKPDDIFLDHQYYKRAFRINDNRNKNIKMSEGWLSVWVLS